MTATKAKNITTPRQTTPAPPPGGEAGIGLRSKHYDALLNDQPSNAPFAPGWLEVHPENYFGGGAPRHYLHQARENYPLSFHATGLSLGSDQPVSEPHLARIKKLIDLFEPFQVSDHVSWSASGNAHLNDLLPLPYTTETLNRLADNIDRTQNYFGRRILIENPSTYLAFTGNDMSESAFLNELTRRTGCGLLLDVNNVYVQSQNHAFDPDAYIDEIDHSAIGEIHLAGHTQRNFSQGSLLIDSHNQPVCEAVWSLYERLIQKAGPRPTLIEWDADLPPLSTLIAEAAKAQTIIDRHRKVANEAA